MGWDAQAARGRVCDKAERDDEWGRAGVASRASTRASHFASPEFGDLGFAHVPRDSRHTAYHSSGFLAPG
jgi:hypothetical protein